MNALKRFTTCLFRCQLGMVITALLEKCTVLTLKRYVAGVPRHMLSLEPLGLKIAFSTCIVGMTSYKWPCFSLQNRPSKEIRPKNDRKPLPDKWSPSQQHVTDVMVQCTECDNWRLIFVKKKKDLTPAKKKQLRDILDGVDYTCGLLFGEFSNTFLQDTCIEMFLYHMKIEMNFDEFKIFMSIHHVAHVKNKCLCVHLAME